MKTSWTPAQIALTVALGLIPLACTDEASPGADDSADDHDDHDHDDETSTTDDGDDDPTTTGDGDGDPTTTGDGDGDDDPTTTGDGDGDPTTTGDGDGDASGLCGAVECGDAMTTDLSLQADKVSEGTIDNTADGEVWTSVLDASAGGAQNAATNPWLYAKFTDQGLVKVELDDLEALESGAWDIAAKRIGVRVNSGSSGPGCVGVAAAAGGFEEVAAAPDGTEYAVEGFYDAACTLISVGEGMASAPAYQIGDWWAYTSCVTTTGQVYLLQLADARVVKLTVDAYYADGQDQCNSDGTMGTGSATVTWRWQFLN